MRVRTKLGCLRKVERVNHNTLRQEYSCWSLNLDLPEEGARGEETACPICGSPLGLRLSSVPRAQTIMATILIVTALGIAGVGGIFTFLASRAEAYVASGQHIVARNEGKSPTFGPGDSATTTTVSYVAYGIAGLILVSAGVMTVLPAGVFAAMGVLVDFSRNPTGFNLAFGEGGHRVIEIDVIPGHVPEPADEAVK